MLTGKAQQYYRQILAHFPHSYFAEDESKIIIGIEPDFLDASQMDFSEFKARFYEKSAKKSLCEYAGYFGIFAADFISLYENVGVCEQKSYEFPLFLFADARAYLVYEKHSKMYHCFGESKYFEFLDENLAQNSHKTQNDFAIISDLKKEKQSFLAMVQRAKENLLSEDFYNYSYYFTEVDNKTLKRIYIKPAGLYVTAYLQGYYDKTKDLYLKMIEFINNNNLSIIGYSYEEVLIDECTTKNPDDYVIKISINVA